MTNRIHITVRSVDALPFEATGQRVYWDDELGGFGVVVGTKTKTFICQHDIDGRSKRRTLGRAGDVKAGFLNATMARERAKGFRQQMRKGDDPRPRSVKLREALERYLTAISTPGTERQASPRTVAWYRDGIERHLGDWLDRDLHKITREMVEQRHKAIPAKVAAGLTARVEANIAAGLAKAHQRRRVERLEAAAKIKRERADARSEKAGRYVANGVMKAFRAIYNHARVLNPQLPPAPTAALTLTRSWFREEGRKAPIGDTSADNGGRLRAWGAMVNGLPNEVQRDWLLFAPLSGMRKRTVSEMRRADVDLDGAVLSIPQPKGGKPYAIPLSRPMIEILRRRLKGNGAYVEADAKCAAWVFPSLDSESGHIEDPRVKGKRAAAVDHWRLHDLRATFINAAMNEDVPRHRYKKLANHGWSKGDDITAEAYENQTPDQLRPYQERISARLMKMIDPKGGEVVKLTTKRRRAAP